MKRFRGTSPVSLQILISFDAYSPQSPAVDNSEHAFIEVILLLAFKFILIMLTIFHGTARINSNSRKIADYYDEVLGKRNIPHQFFTLENVDDSIFNKTFHNPKHPQLQSIEDHILGPTSKFIFIIPEYNGSFPGMFKGFIDASDVKKCFHNKKACLTGVADGRAGNLRGMEHLTNIFNHMKMNVLHFKIPISQVSTHLDAQGKLQSDEIKAMIDQQLDLMLDF